MTALSALRPGSRVWRCYTGKFASAHGATIVRVTDHTVYARSDNSGLEVAYDKATGRALSRGGFGDFLSVEVPAGCRAIGTAAEVAQAAMARLAEQVAA